MVHRRGRVQQQNVAWLIFIGWAISFANEWEGYFNYFWDTVISRNWAITHSLVFWECLGTVLAPLGVSFSLLIEDQGLIKVDLSAMLDPFDSVQFMLCPWATSFFQKWCPAPFPPVTKLSVQISHSVLSHSLQPHGLQHTRPVHHQLPEFTQTHANWVFYTNKKFSALSSANINNLRYVDDTTLMAESEKELKSLLKKLKQESEKVGLKLNIQKTKIMASSPITSWHIDGETVPDFIFLGSKVTDNGECSHEIKRCSLEGKLWPT